MVYRTCPPRATPWYVLLLLLALHLPGLASNRHNAAQVTKHANAQAASEDGVAEASLMEVYALMAKGQSRSALEKASKVVQDHPNFQLAQLVYGDLLAARVRSTRSVSTVGDVPADLATAGAEALVQLRDESQKRINASRDRPHAGMVPSQFLQISPKTRYAIAVDASRSPLVPV